MAKCPHCGSEIGFFRYFLTDHVTGDCVTRLRVNDGKGEEE